MSRNKLVDNFAIYLAERYMVLSEWSANWSCSQFTLFTVIHLRESAVSVMFEFNNIQLWESWNKYLFSGKSHETHEGDPRAVFLQAECLSFIKNDTTIPILYVSSNNFGEKKFRNFWPLTKALKGMCPYIVLWLHYGGQWKDILQNFYFSKNPTCVLEQFWQAQAVTFNS